MRFRSWLRSLRRLSNASIGGRSALPRQWRRLRSAPLGVEQFETRLTLSYVLSALASFNGTNGAHPWAGLIMDSSGNLYCTTKQGGASGDGTVFELAASVFRR
jgi:uncharacterized repeat protein (TIGR03803 family)